MVFPARKNSEYEDSLSIRRRRNEHVHETNLPKTFFSNESCYSKAYRSKTVSIGLLWEYLETCTLCEYAKFRTTPKKNKGVDAYKLFSTGSTILLSSFNFLWHLKQKIWIIFRIAKFNFGWGLITDLLSRLIFYLENYLAEKFENLTEILVNID